MRKNVKNVLKLWKHFFLKQFWGFVLLCFAPGSHCFAIAKFNRSADSPLPIDLNYSSPIFNLQKLSRQQSNCSKTGTPKNQTWRKRNQGSTFPTGFSNLFSHFWRIFSHFFRIFFTFFFAFFQVHFQNPFFSQFFRGAFSKRIFFAFFTFFTFFHKHVKNVKNVKNVKKNAFWKCASKNMWKIVFWKCTWKNAKTCEKCEKCEKCVKNAEKCEQNAKNVKKRFENPVGKVELWFLLLQVWFFWVPVLLQLLCCLPNFCRLKIGEEQFKSIGSGLSADLLNLAIAKQWLPGAKHKRTKPQNCFKKKCFHSFNTFFTFFRIFEMHFFTFFKIAFLNHILFNFFTFFTFFHIFNWSLFSGL